MKKNYPIYITIGALIIINVIFLWNEPFYYFWKKPFYHSFPFDAAKFSAVVSIVAVVLNSLTIFLLYKQIEEMAEARKSSYQPVLMPKETFLRTFDYKNFLAGSNTLPTSLFIKKTKSIDKMDESYLELQFDYEDYELPMIEIYNLGLGAAINVDCQWDFEIQEVKEFIKDTYSDDEEDEIEDDSLFNFINPQSSVEKQLPMEYMKMYGKLLNGNQQNIKPSLYLNIYYEDINGYKYHYKFLSNIIGIGTSVEVNFRKIK